jgi:hypothetical protein
MKILPVRAELFHVERRTDMSNLIDAFRNFANAPKMLSNESHMYEHSPSSEALLSLSLFSEASLRSLVLIMRLITAV